MTTVAGCQLCSPERIRVRLPGLLLLPVLLLPACTAGTGGSDTGGSGTERAAGAEREGGDSTAVSAPSSLLQEPTGGPAVVPGTTAGELATGASQALYASAPLVVLAGEGDLPAQAQAASVSVSLGAPLLLTPSGPGGSEALAGELERLTTDAVLVVGEPSRAWADQLDGPQVVLWTADDDDLQALTGLAPSRTEQVVATDVVAATAGLTRGAEVPLLSAGTVAAGPAGDPDAAQELQAAAPEKPAESTVLLVTPDPAGVAAVATARAAGAQVVLTTTADPRADGAVVKRLAELTPERILGLGSAFGAEPQFASRVASAGTGVELPGGGQLVLPGKRYVALYGHPGSSALGVLGEQGAQDSVIRAAELAADYAAVRPDAFVVPTFEMIATVASSSAGPDGNFSNEATIEQLRGYVDAAAASGTYVLLDLQPGYSDFLTQAKLYEELLKQPHVGLALDPEWRLAPGQRHLVQIGRVGADEVNAVGDWLATLVRDNALPQKMLLLHQFKLFMLEERERIVADRDELAVVTQMDGNGPPSTKVDTWNVLRPGAPAGMVFGWKNFYDEDTPTLTPAQTMAVEPTPVFVSYQ